MHWRCLSKTEVETSLFQAIRLFIRLTETEYNGSFLDAMPFASIVRCTRLMPKTNCSIKFLHDSLTAKGHREKKEGLNTSLPERIPQLLINFKKGSHWPSSHRLQTENSMMHASQGSYARPTPWFLKLNDICPPGRPDHLNLTKEHH